MANEITYSFNLAVRNGSYRDGFTKSNATINQAAQGASSGILTVDTETALPTGSVSTEGVCILHNLSEEYTITWGPDDSGQTTVGSLKPGEMAMFRLQPATTVLLSSTPYPSPVEFILLED